MQAMIVVAGPAGSGKSRWFSVYDFGVSPFSVDDRCRDLNGGSYEGIPPHIRQKAGRECEEFVKKSIADSVGFATETTLSGNAPAIAQAREAKEAGFFTSMIYVGTNDVELNVERIIRRGLNGGHSAKPEVIREIYRQSLENLPEAIKAFHRVDIYDNSGSFDDEPELMLRIRDGEIEYMHESPPKWIQGVCAKMLG